MRLLLLAALMAVLGCNDRAPSVAAPALPEGYAEPGDPALRPREGDQDCEDFDTHEQAQRFFEIQGGPGRDLHGLDPDDNGRACEELL